MNVFTLYYDRYETATTSEALWEAGINHNVLCHNNKNKFKNILDICIQKTIVNLYTDFTYVTLVYT